MIRKTVVRHCCEHCGKQFVHINRAEFHEDHCFKNPNRTPYFGEITSVMQMGKIKDFGTSDYLPTGCTWYEWVEYDTMPAWWPSNVGEYGGAGCIYTLGGWMAVENYRQTPAEGAHGCAGGSPPVEHWPTEEFPTLRTYQRLDYVHGRPINVRYWYEKGCADPREFTQAEW